MLDWVINSDKGMHMYYIYELEKQTKQIVFSQTNF